MKQWFDRWMFEGENVWVVLAVANVVLAIVFGVLAIFVEQNRWVMLFDAAFAGFNLAQALGARGMMLSRRSFRQMHDAYSAMHELNGQLLSGQFEAMIIRGRGDDDPPPATKLH